MQSIVVDSVLMVLILSGVPMITIALTSGTVALIQAATQIQEQSIIHLVRLVSFLVLVFILGDWAGGEFIMLFERSLKTIELIGQGAR